jgi:hypothetical protein
MTGGSDHHSRDAAPSKLTLHLRLRDGIAAHPVSKGSFEANTSLTPGVRIHEPASPRVAKRSQSMEQIMTPPLDDLLPTAKDFQKKLALAEVEEASKEMRKRKEAEAEKKALLEQLARPSGVSDAERLKRAVAIIERAVGNGLTEVELIRFPNSLCTDRGRAINQQEPGWENTLTGLPMELYQTWAQYFRPRGYKLRVQIVDFPGGVPGDVGMTLSWS